MSITLTKKLNELVSYPEIGVACQPSKVTKEVTYSAKRLISLSEGNAQVLFEVSVGDSVIQGEYFHMFSYSGTGNPLDEAEESLKNSLS